MPQRPRAHNFFIVFIVPPPHILDLIKLTFVPSMDIYGDIPSMLTQKGYPFIEGVSPYL
jgi:hypothetical protein